MDRDLDAVRKGVQGNVNAVALAPELRNRFPANVSRSLGKLRTRLRLKSRMDSLMFHGAAKHADQAPILVQVKHDTHGLIGHWIRPATLISHASRQSGQ